MMNWSNEGHSQDSEIYPRRKPPVGHGIQNVPPVRPMVPEVSMFVTNPDRRNYFDNSSKKVSTETNQDSIASSSLAPIQPAPQRPPSVQQWKPTSDLSVMFQDTLDLSVSQLNMPHKTVYSQESRVVQTAGNSYQPKIGDRNPTSQQDIRFAHTQSGGCLASKIDDKPIQLSTGHTKAATMNWNPTASTQRSPQSNSLSQLPSDVADVIKWQTEQILLLKEQVKKLMDCFSPQSATKSLPKPSPKVTESSTQTSAPTSPKLHRLSFGEQKESANQIDSEKPELDFSGQKEFAEYRQRLNGTHQPNVQKNIPNADAYKQNRQMTNQRTKPPFPNLEVTNGSKESLSFSSSLNTLNDEIECDRDVIPPDNINDIIYQESRVPDQPEASIANSKTAPPREECPTLARLREMGVSFVNKEDLVLTSKSAPDVNPTDSTMSWYPRAVAESLGTPSMITSTSEYSLLLNSAAIKYLNDDELASVAQRSPRSYPSPTVRNLQALAPTIDMSRFGMPEEHLSDATKNFLSQHHLTKKSNF